jgi:hypothetical protein
MDINRDIQSHFKRFPQYITPSCVVFYDVKDYNNYMKTYNDDIEKKYKIVEDNIYISEASKK